MKKKEGSEESLIEDRQLPVTSAQRPWLDLYEPGRSSDLIGGYGNVVEMFLESCRRCPNQDAIRYFDGIITLSELERRSSSLALSLREGGFEPGERLVIYAQNNPAFVVAMLATWKAGGIVVTANPMYKTHEFEYIIIDSKAAAVVYLDDLKDIVYACLDHSKHSVRMVYSFSALDDQTRNDPRVIADGIQERNVSEAGWSMWRDMSAVIAGNKDRQYGSWIRSVPDEVALIVYTSGTTGMPKGAELTHGNLISSAIGYREWMDLQPDEPILAIAPLFHITGLVGHAITSLLVPSPLVLTHRFEPSVVLEAIREHKPVFTLPAITAFIALAGADGINPKDFETLRKVYSGGAPVAAALVDRFEREFGVYIRNAYGLTETASMTFAVPAHLRAPVDHATGALSIGIPVMSVVARIINDRNEEVGTGEIGELVISGPQVARGYWNRPEASAETFPNGVLHTGDVGFMDSEGWFYLVDRKKDMIIASGYKVWPREVEDVLYTHPAVHEVAVVGVPDEYRGETVHAVVSRVRDVQVTEQELIDFCKAQMAAYKYPRSVEFVDELPKTASGKIKRNDVREMSFKR